MSERRKITIIGAGKVGQSLAQLLKLDGHEVRQLGRGVQQQRAAVTDAELVLLTVTDREIEPVCDSIAEYCSHGAVVAHCSGSLDSSVLHTARQQGCHVASIHPLNTFPNLDAALRLFSDTQHNTWLYCEGDQVALDRLIRISKAIGFKPVVIDSKAKTLYHAACVFACNYLTSLMDLSLNTAQEAGLDRQQYWQAIQPLVQATLENIDKSDTVAALSGPIARGDTGIIEQHLDKLTNTQATYKALGLATLELARKKDELSERQIQELRKLLS